MYNLFNHGKLNKGELFDVPSFNTTRKLINSEVDRIIGYYKNTNFVVPQTHLLCQILRQLTVSFKRDLASFTSVCYDEIPRLSMLFNLIHYEVSNPEIRHGLFYNSSTPEYIVADETLFDYDHAYKHWKKLTPVRVHYHGYSDLNVPLLNGNYKNPVRENSYAVISINIPLLALQYRAWLENEVVKYGDSASAASDETSILKRLEHFVFKYPLLNASYNHVELALINRTLNHYRELPVGKYFRLHPINVVNLTDIVDRTLKERVAVLKRNKFRVHQFMSAFSGLKKQNWSKVLTSPEIVKTRTTKWVNELIYLEYTSFLLSYFSEHGIVFDINPLKRTVRNLENDSIFYKGSNYPYNKLFERIKAELG